MLHTCSCARSLFLSLPLTVRPDFTEMTVLGATIAAGLAANVWKDTSQLPKATTKIYEPKISADGAYNNSGDVRMATKLCA